MSHSQFSGRKRAWRSTSTCSDNHRDHVIPALPPSLRPDSVEIVAAAILEPSSRIAPIFIGESGYSDILDATGGLIDRHFHVPATAEQALAAEDLEYLKAKGCFTLPAESKQLLEAYFLFVHPTFPVVDGSLFLQGYAVSGLEGINLLLLWSMFSVSASYIPTLPRKACKEAYANRAKLLFDLSQENDKIVLVQSALLLSFWFADTEDVKQSWYWTGVAFSIAQTLGLHHEVRSANAQVTVQQRSLWRNIWHCCMIRDVWLAFSMGRPLRIEASDCYYSVSEETDCQFTKLTLHDKKLYSLKEAAGFVSMWQSLITTSNVLRDIMTNKTLSPWQAEFFEGRINVQDTSSSTFLLTHVNRHLKLHQYAAIIALARASGLEEVSGKAADSTTAIMQAFLYDNTTVYAAPVTVPLVIPAMVTYLTTTNSKRPEARKLGNDKLNLYIRFFTAMEDNYPAASILKRVLAAAQDAITGKRRVRRDEEKV
ncbi:hypothetical protein BU25DRAFT_405082 [Macroventuria anomochaeta]|uniref:Uncharacterized protein n=1 Tax=Macroventuria anomochaeta TaxID=301207 RepID=A0ACB6SFP2_9PLEO|nr:uncharacterized protein BU25DRAFT_405082 [Macroventuria anomochaeta]KAF2633141.1 hypothetical protein BU25DRAFT_405082 [Macroventuria anomochaeta]